MKRVSDWAMAYATVACLCQLDMGLEAAKTVATTAWFLDMDIQCTPTRFGR